MKETYFKTKYMAAGILLVLNASAMTYFKFKLQLKFVKNKNYSSIIVNFPADLP